MAASATTLAAVTPAQAGPTSGLLSTPHEFGAAIGVAATSSLALASISGMRRFSHAFAVTAVVALVSALVSLGAVPGRPRP